MALNDNKKKYKKKLSAMRDTVEQENMFSAPAGLKPSDIGSDFSATNITKNTIIGKDKNKPLPNALPIPLAIAHTPYHTSGEPNTTTLPVYPTMISSQKEFNPKLPVGFTAGLPQKDTRLAAISDVVESRINALVNRLSKPMTHALRRIYTQELTGLLNSAVALRNIAAQRAGTTASAITRRLPSAIEFEKAKYNLPAEVGYKTSLQQQADLSTISNILNMAYGGNTTRDTALELIKAGVPPEDLGSAMSAITNIPVSKQDIKRQREVINTLLEMLGRKPNKKKKSKFEE